MFKFRSIASYFSFATLLTFATWSAYPQTRDINAFDSPGITVGPGGTILNRTGITYPGIPGQAPVEGTIIVELSLNEKGEVSDAHVQSGPEELRRAVLQSVLGWRYDLSKLPSRRAVVTVQFQTPPNFGKTPQPKGPIEKIDVSAMPIQFQGTLLARLRQFEGLPVSSETMRQIQELLKIDAPNADMMLFPSGQGQTLRIAPADNSIRQQPRQFDPTPGVMRIRVGEIVQRSNLLNSVNPEYPAIAKQALIQGRVLFDAIIGTDGHVTKLSVVSGHPLLIPAAQNAVKQNVYRPTLLNGNPVEVQTQVDVDFRL